MSGKVRQGIGSILTIVGYATTSYYGIGYVLIAAGAWLGYDGAKRAAKEAERRARAGQRAPSIKGNVRGSHEHHQLVFGKARVGGIVVGVGTDGGPDMANQFLYLAVAHSITHPGGCDGIGDIWLDDTRITAAQMSGDPNAGIVSVNAGVFSGLIRLRHYRGTSTQNADSTLVTALVDPASAHRRGIAWTWIECKRSTDEEAFRAAFKFGIPQLSVELRGQRVYDPRKDSTNGGSGAHRYSDPTTWEFTSGTELGSNPALCAATYAIMAVSDGGCGRPATGVDWPSVASMATLCEEPISTPAGNRSRFRTNGVIGTTDKRDVNMQKLLDSCMGKRVTISGKWKFYGAAYRVPTVAIDQTWLSGPVQISTRSPLESLYNAVRVNFDDASVDYKTIEAPPYTSATYESQDGGYRVWRDMTLPMVSDVYNASYLAQIVHKQSRKQMTATVALNMKALDIEVWETCTLSFPDSGVDLSTKVWRVVSWEPKGAEFLVALQEDDSGIYTVDAMATPNSGSAPVVGSETPPAVAGLTASAMADGIMLKWTAVNSTFARKIQIERATSSGGAFSVIGEVASTSNSYIDQVLDGATYFYKVRARGVTALSAYSNEVSATAKQSASAGSVNAFNTGFEDGDQNWTKGTGWAIVNEPANARASTWAGKFTGVAAAALRNARKVPVAPGDLVTAFGFVKSSAGASGSAYARICWLDIASAELSTSDGNVVTTTTSYTQSRKAAAAPASAAYARVEFVASAPAGGTWYADDAYLTVTPKDLDEVPDGGTYNRVKGTAVTNGEVDVAKAGVINRSADNISESGARKWAAESGAQVVTGKSLTVLVDRNLGNIADDATYGRTKLTALTSGEVDLSKAGVLNRTGDNIAESATRKWAAESGAQVVTGKSLTVLVDRNLGNIADDATYGRTKATALTSGEVDMTKSGVLNRTADNISEATTRKWAAESGADVTSGKSLTVLTNRTLANISDTADRFAAPVANATSDITFVASGGMTLGGNTATKAGVIGWNEQVYSKDGYRGGACAQATPEFVNAYVMFGLNTDPTTDADYQSIDYAMYCVNDGTLQAYESATDRGQIGTYVAGDVLAVTYDGTKVRYLKNGAVLRTVAANPNLIFFFDSSFYTVGGKLSRMRFIPMSSNDIDNVGEGVTYGRTKLTALTSGEVDLSKAGVLNRNADNIAEATTRKWAAESGADVTSGKSLTVLTNRTLGNIADDATYGRTKLTALTAGEVDLSLAGVLNRTAANISETGPRKWAAESGADVTSGKSITILADVATSARFYTFTQVFTSGTAATTAIPTGARLLNIRAFGGAGSGRLGGASTTCKGGGGGGAAKKTVLITDPDWGGNITRTVGTGGAARAAIADGLAGTATTVTSSGLSFTNLNISANAGTGGTSAANGAGGTATGGDTNVTGLNGTGAAAAGFGDGGNSGTVDSIFGKGGTGGASGSPGIDGKAPGGGGSASDATPSGAGAAGAVHYVWS